VILYRKAAPLRIRRTSAPEPPFWCATTIAPYGARRGVPVAIDYVALRASGADRAEVNVCENVRDELERMRTITAPVLIEATENTETVFRRGEDALAFCDGHELAAMFLTSTRGELPSREAVLVVCAWPLDLPRLEALFASARTPWGVAVPLLYPVTTDLAALESLADSAHAHGAAFFASIPMEMEPTAKQAIAQSMHLDGEDDRYALLFHGDIAPIHLATERHIAALAAERGMAEFIVPPRWEERSNWNAAILLTRTASRMISMELDLDLAGLIARSARAIAELDKPLARIAESASLSIVGGVDETSVEMLTEWLGSGSAAFSEYVSEQWRLRRV
jgi:hypothetical protein